MSRSDIPEGSPETARPDRNTLIAFVLMVVFAGGNPVAVRFSNSGLPPFWGAAIRFAAAALIFWIIVLVRRIALPRGRALMGALLYGLLAVGAAYAFLYWGLLRAPAGLAGAVLAFVPLMTLFFAWAHGLEMLRWRGLIGALVATAGILVGVVGGFGSAVHVPSLLALVAGTACLTEAAVVFKLFPQSHPMATNALALTTGAPLLFVLSLLAGEQWTLPTTPNTWASFAYLVLIGSVVVFYLYLHVLARWTASATSYAFLLIPVATVVIAAWLAGEVITTSFVIGGALVLAGVWVGAIHSAPEAADLTCSEMPSKAIC
jgi:drug/metabolite transporter (DMT)-like permease